MNSLSFSCHRVWRHNLAPVDSIPPVSTARLGQAAGPCMARLEHHGLPRARSECDLIYGWRRLFYTEAIRERQSDTGSRFHSITDRWNPFTSHLTWNRCRPVGQSANAAGQWVYIGDTLRHIGSDLLVWSMLVNGSRCNAGLLKSRGTGLLFRDQVTSVSITTTYTIDQVTSMSITTTYTKKIRSHTRLL